MGVIADYTDIPPLTGADLPSKLGAGDAPAKWVTAPTGTTAQIVNVLGVKDNAIIDAINLLGAKINAIIDTTELVGQRTNSLINNMNWLGNNFENVELIGNRRYLAYMPGEEPAEQPEGL